MHLSNIRLSQIFVFIKYSFITNIRIYQIFVYHKYSFISLGTPVLSVSATDYDDPNEGSNAVLNYALLKNVIDERSGRFIFSINRTSGAIATSLCCLDREHTAEYGLILAATDGGGLQGIVRRHFNFLEYPLCMRGFKLFDNCFFFFCSQAFQIIYYFILKGRPHGRTRGYFTSYFCTCTTFLASYTYKSTCVCTSTTSSNHVQFLYVATRVRRTNVRASFL